MANIINLEIPYPDFVNGDVIRDQEIDDNNASIVNKINEAVNKVNVHDVSIINIEEDVITITAVADEALFTSETALSKANTALTNSTTAVGAANAAVVTANAAAGDASVALSTANTAISYVPLIEQAVLDVEQAVADVASKADVSYVDQVAANFVLGEVSDGSIVRTKLAIGITNELDGLRSDVNAASGDATQALSNAASAQGDATQALSDAASAQGDATSALNSITTLLPKNQGTLESYSEKLLTNATSIGTVTLDLSIQDVFDLTLTGNTTLAFSNIPTTGKAASCTVLIRQGGVAYSLTFPASVKFASDSVPDVSAINKTHILSFYTVNSGTRWYCTPALNFAT